MLAATFIFHGAQILFGLFGGPGVQGFADRNQISSLLSWLVGAAELGGGVSMLLGFLVKVGGLAIAAVMAGAIIRVHLPNGFDIVHQGMEYALTELVFAFAVASMGAGAYSLDALLSRPRSVKTTIPEHAACPSDRNASPHE